MEEKGSLMEILSIIPDPRLERTKKHKLVDVLVIAVCGILSGCETWVDIEDYGTEKENWFKQFLELPNGVPSHDTFGRVFSLLEPEVFQKAFFEWIKEIRQTLGRDIVSIDGKFLNGSLQESGRPRSAISIVSAWASEAGLFLGQKSSELKKEQGEKRAMENLIEDLYLKGCIVTTDANGATTRITEKIIQKGGDYLIGLKSNQKILLKYGQRAFEEGPKLVSYRTENKGHGREECREYYQLDLSSYKISEGFRKGWEKQIQKWPNMKSFVKVCVKRKAAGKTTEETRFYFSSLHGNVEEAAKAIRSHWGVENSLHWVMDVVFGEDHSQVRMGHAAENLALVRRMALNMLKQHDVKRSLRRKQKKCSWNNDYLLETLMAQPSI